MKIKIIGGVAALAAVTAAAEVSFDADTMAFYPFSEGVDESPVTTSYNAVNAERFPAKATNHSTTDGVRFSDDVPGDYIFANESAKMPLYAAGEYRSVRFPNNYDPTASVTTNQYGLRSCSTMLGASLLKLTDTFSEIKTNTTDWTVEFFFKTDIPYGPQCIFATGDVVNKAVTADGTENFAGVILCDEATDGCGRLAVSMGKGQTGSKFVNPALSWNAMSNRGKSQSLVDGLWRHCAVRYNNTTQKIDVLLNYGVVTGSAGLDYKIDRAAEKLNNMMFGAIRDFQGSWSGSQFVGKIAAVRITKRFLEPSELMRAGDTADQSAPKTVFHLSYNDQPVGAEIQDPPRGTRTRTHQGCVAGDKHRTSWRSLGMFNFNDTLKEYMYFSDEIPAKGMIKTGDGDLVQNYQSFKLDNGDPDASQGGGIVYWKNHVQRYLTAENAFTYETFFKLIRLRPNMGTPAVLAIHNDATGVSASNGYGLYFGYTAGGTKLSLVYHPLTESGVPAVSRVANVVNYPVGTSSVSDCKWHHFAMTWNPVTKKLRYWYDYKLVAEYTSEYGILNKPSTIRVACSDEPDRNGWTASPVGYVDETRLSSVELSSSEFVKFVSGKGMMLLFR